jgi:hypothetical protein
MIVNHMKHAFVTACLGAGVAVAKQTDRDTARRLVHRLHPVVTTHPLIRVGAHGDGGYLVPDDLDGIAACFSPGVVGRARSDQLRYGALHPQASRRHRRRYDDDA